MKLKHYLIFISTLINSYLVISEDWTWSYRRKFNLQESKTLIDKPNIIFSKTQVPEFTQLVFSWNAYRPENGYYTFFIQPRYAITKKWGNWYKMIDWGAKIQKSYSVKKEKINYQHVRLEMPHGKFSDGFRLRVEKNGGACLSNLRLLNICISNFDKFLPSEDISKYYNLSSIIIKNIPKKSQQILNHDDSKVMCSPTSTTMLLEYLSKKRIDPVKFALKVYDSGLNAYGSWPFNTSSAFEICSTHFFRVIRLNSFVELHNRLSNGFPVVVSVRGKLATAPKEYDKGHLILVIGWDKRNRKVICHDPAFDTNEKVYHKYDLRDFLNAWEKSHNLAYIVEKRHED